MQSVLRRAKRPFLHAPLLGISKREERPRHMLPDPGDLSRSSEPASTVCGHTTRLRRQTKDVLATALFSGDGYQGGGDHLPVGLERSVARFPSSRALRLARTRLGTYGSCRS